ncbi:MAG TPA: response regulator [Terriglobales bacterium]|nr:response regulator [Terriglobales bacterium]
MGHRHEERTPLRLTTLVWGVDGHGHVFMEQVQTLDISSRGARLKGLQHPVSVGSVLGVQNGDNQGRFRVVWIGEAGSAREGQIGLHCIQIGRSAKKSLLYVDDQEHELDRRRSLLEAFGYRVHTTLRGQQALEALESIPVDATILDHPLLDLDTVAMIECIKALQPQARVILLSAFPATIPERALELSDAFVHKGENHSRLTTTIEQLVGPGNNLKWPITRCLQRYAVSVPVAVNVLRSGINTRIHGRSTDLSEGGGAIEIDAGELVPGEIISVEFSLPTATKPLHMYCTVRHRKENRYGVEFVTIDPEQRQSILDLCQVLVPMDQPQ